MTFSAFSFIYDNVCSEDYGLCIGSIDGNQIEKSSASTNTELVFDSILNRSENFVYGVKQTDNALSFDIELISKNPMSRSDISYIDSWLFSNSQPKKLVFCQGDMLSYAFYAIFSKNEIKSIGGLPYVISCKVVCSSAYAYEAEKCKEYIIPEGEVLSERFNNLSGGIQYLFPKITFVCNKDNGQIKIKNTSDNNREFVISGLSNGEEITIDEWFQITSSTGLYRLANCNKKWLRLKNGINYLQFSGDTSKISMYYSFRKGIGS